MSTTTEPPALSKSERDAEPPAPGFPSFARDLPHLSGGPGSSPGKIAPGQDKRAQPPIRITGLTLWQVPLTSHVTYTMASG
ncbi:MAG: hypothetical protein AAFP67_09385, partial [Pseudomonadota bacterium]